MNSYVMKSLLKPETGNELEYPFRISQPRWMLCGK